MIRNALLILFLFFSSTAIAMAPEVQVINEVKPEGFSVSHNVVFIVDSSSTMYNYDHIYRRFEAAWRTVVNEFASDELYFKVYVFNDKKNEQTKKWVDAGGPAGMKEFEKALKWIKTHTGTYSWASQTFRKALREKNPLDKKASSNKRLTVVIISDGGFTEAADVRTPGTDDFRENGIFNGEYFRTGSFKIFDKIIAKGQAWRKKNKLDPATIVTVCIENEGWPTMVKRSDADCKAWMKKTGKKYKGGYFSVKDKEEK